MILKSSEIRFTRVEVRSLDGELVAAYNGDPRLEIELDLNRVGFVHWAVGPTFGSPVLDESLAVLGPMFEKATDYE